jgi:hypothetical protein
MTMSKPDPNSLDWDADLRTLLEDHGIDPDRNKPLTKAQRRRRYLRKSRRALAATVASVAAAWIIARSGAPAAAVVPLMAWIFAQVVHGFWKVAGSPGWRQMGTAAGTRTQRALLLLIRWLGRTFWYPITQQIRIRLRARRLAAVQ